MAFSITLPASKSYAERIALWSPSTLLALAGVGVLEIREAKKVGGNPAVRRYLVKEEAGRPSHERVFAMTKAGDSEDDPKRYVCLNLKERSLDLCDCKWGLAGGDCAHKQAFRGLLTKGFLPPAGA